MGVAPWLIRPDNFTVRSFFPQNVIDVCANHRRGGQMRFASCGLAYEGGLFTNDSHGHCALTGKFIGLNVPKQGEKW